MEGGPLEMMPNSVNKHAMNQSMTTSHGFTNEDKSWTTRRPMGTAQRTPVHG